MAEKRRARRQRQAPTTPRPSEIDYGAALRRDLEGIGNFLGNFQVSATPELEGMDPDRLRRRGLDEGAIQNLLQDEPTDLQYGHPITTGFGNVAPRGAPNEGFQNALGRVFTRSAIVDEGMGGMLERGLSAPGRWADRTITQPTVEAARDVGRGVSGASKSATSVINEQIERAVSNLATDNITKLAGLFSRNRQ